MQPSLTHLALHVADLEGCVRFYEDYCGLRCTHRRGDPGAQVAWLSEPDREQQFVLVLIAGGPQRTPPEHDYSHLGFAVESEAEVDALAERARKDGRLMWPPRREPYPVGYYCGVLDPGGNAVEFSYGQPLGPKEG